MDFEDLSGYLSENSWISINSRTKNFGLATMGSAPLLHQLTFLSIIWRTFHSCYLLGRPAAMNPQSDLPIFWFSAGLLLFLILDDVHLTHPSWISSLCRITGCASTPTPLGAINRLYPQVLGLWPNATSALICLSALLLNLMNVFEIQLKS